MDRHLRLRALLAPDGCGVVCGLASVLQRWPVGLDGCWLVLVFGLLLGLGAVPLCTLVLPFALGLVLGARFGLGTVVGELALLGRLLWLGAVAARRLLFAELWLHLLWQFLRIELLFWPVVGLLHVRVLSQLPQPPL